MEKEIASDGEVTEMEVRVDPMIILQCCEDTLEENFPDEENSNEPKSMSERKVGARSKKILLNMQENNRVQTDGDKETESGDNNSDDDLRDEFKTMYSCPICGKKISTKGNLKVHLETHRPKGKYGCDICGRM